MKRIKDGFFKEPPLSLCSALFLEEPIFPQELSTVLTQTRWCTKRTPGDLWWNSWGASTLYSRKMNKTLTNTTVIASNSWGDNPNSSKTPQKFKQSSKTNVGVAPFKVFHIFSGVYRYTFGIVLQISKEPPLKLSRANFWGGRTPQKFRSDW